MDGISMNNYQFAYGDGTVTLPLVGGNILGELHGTPVSINRTTAEADIVICLGAVTHHVMAGFGGGPG